MGAATAAKPISRLVAIVFGVLVLATFAAFFLAAKLKSEPGVVHHLVRTRYFSPNGDGVRDIERIALQVTRRDRLTIDVVDAQEGRVRRIASGLRARPGQPVRVTWNGRTDRG